MLSSVYRVRSPLASSIIFVDDDGNKAVENQVQLDEQVVELAQMMKETFEVANRLNDIRDRLKTFDSTIDAVLKQSYECSLFIQKYTRKGFIGNIKLFNTMFASTDMTYFRTNVQDGQ